MTNSFSKCATAVGGSALTLTVLLGLEISSGARAGEVEAKSLLKAMSDYMALQNSISFDYDADYEVVTRDNQRIALASSGTVAMADPIRFAPHA